MAEKRAFAAEVLESDVFTNLSLEAKLLYMYINMKSDDDGLCSKVKIAAVLSGVDNRQAAIDDLVSSGFLIPVENTDRVIISHWHVHNKIRGDMHKATLHPDDFQGIFRQPGKRGADIYTLRNTGIPAYTAFEESEPCVQSDSVKEKESIISKKQAELEQHVVEFQSQWNEIDGVKPVQEVTNVPSQRMKSYLALLKKYGNDAAISLLKHVKTSDFLRGKVGREGDYEKFIVSIDWALKPENTEKIMNGNYDDSDMHQAKNHVDDEISKLY